jgi:hypothetical protein
MRSGDLPATWGVISGAFKEVAAAIKPSPPDIGKSVAPKRVSSPTIPGTGSVEPKGAPGENRSGLFGTSPDKEAI